MKKMFLIANLIMAAGLAAPRILSAESGIIFNASSGTVTGQLVMGVPGTAYLIPNPCDLP